MKIAVVILAGGEGRRMGGNKPLRMLGGVSLLDRAIAYANRLTSLSAIEVRREGQAGNVEIPLLRDDAEIEGPLAGLVTALRFARDEGAESSDLLFGSIVERGNSFARSQIQRFTIAFAAAVVFHDNEARLFGRAAVHGDEAVADDLAGLVFIYPVPACTYTIGPPA